MEYEIKEIKRDIEKVIKLLEDQKESRRKILDKFFKFAMVVIMITGYTTMIVTFAKL